MDDYIRHTIATRYVDGTGSYEASCSCGKWRQMVAHPVHAEEAAGPHFIELREAARLAPIRARVDRLADYRRTGWYTQPVRDRATRLADAMLTAAADIDPRATLDAFDGVTSIIGGCFDVAAALAGREPPLSAVTRESLLVRLVAALAQRGILATRRGGAVLLDEKPGPVMSRWRYPLQISLYTEPAWDLTLAAPSGFTSVVSLYSTFDDAGAEGIADLVAALAEGEIPDPFRA